MNNEQAKKKWGFIQVYTGKGKGKTTAALGLAIRAAGRGKKTAIIYFDKGGFNYGERRILDQLKGKIDYFVTGLDRIDPETGKFRFGATAGDKKEAKKGLELAKELALKYDLMILDEINSTVNLGMLSLEEFLKFLDAKPEGLELALTGRDCPKEVQERADLITETSLVKHYFYNGVEAREGIEY